MNPRVPRPLPAASVSRTPTGVDINLWNPSSRRVQFFVVGVDPEAYITLDGNTNYSVQMLVQRRSSIVEVRLKDRQGDVLCWIDPREVP